MARQLLSSSTHPRLEGRVGGEAFDLRAHAATDLLRLHFVHDIVRLERFGSAGSGLAVLLTNESGLWTQSARKSRDRDFHLHEGRQLSGALLWAEGTYAPTHESSEAHMHSAGRTTRASMISVAATSAISPWRSQIRQLPGRWALMAEITHRRSE